MCFLKENLFASVRAGQAQPWFMFITLTIFLSDVEGIMTVQFVAHFSLSFWWYFQKNVTEPDGPPSPATPKVSFTFKEKTPEMVQHVLCKVSFFGLFTCFKHSFYFRKWAHTKDLSPCWVLHAGSVSGHMKKRYQTVTSGDLSRQVKKMDFKTRALPSSSDRSDCWQTISAMGLCGSGIRIIYWELIEKKKVWARLWKWI